MRRRLVVVFVATTSLVCIAFVVPLAALVRNIANERAIDDATRDAAAVFPVLAVTDDSDVIAIAVSRTRSGSQGRLGVFLCDGTVVGDDIERTPRLERACTDGTAWTGDVTGGATVLAPVVRGDGRTAVVQVFVPSSELTAGVRRAWLALALVGLALIAGSVLLADRLARSIIRPVEALADASARLGAGELDARVDPQGNDEIAEVGARFNVLAQRVQELLDAEREEVADLAHQLRTPLAALRLQLDQVTDSLTREAIIDSADDLARTVDRVIAETRVRTEPSLDPNTDLSAAIRDRTSFWSVLAEDQGRGTEVVVPEHVVMANVAREAIDTALDVVLENVFSHTDEGTDYRVELTADDEAVITVDDHGDGFAHTGAIERGASGVGSTGLGLDIARRVATYGGGTLEVGVNRWGGGRVQIRLPLR